MPDLSSNVSSAPDSAQDARAPVPASLLNQLSPSSRRAIERLNAHTPPARVREDFGNLRTAAVLVALFERPGEGELRCLLTTRSKHLRSHPGQTALPGGKVDAEDRSAMHAARREAFEETGLVQGSSPLVHEMGTLPPFLSKYGLIVHACVVLIDFSLIATLVASPAEVDRIWDLPIASAINTRYWPDKDGGLAQLSELGGEDWLYTEETYNQSDVAWTDGTLYRMHRFRSPETPLKGLTSDVLIEVASIAYGQQPDFEWYPAGQDRSTWERVIDVLVAESKEAGWLEKRKKGESGIQR